MKYLATDEYTYSSGTASIATAYFKVINDESGNTEITYEQPETRMVTPDNQPITIKTYGIAKINID